MVRIRMDKLVKRFGSVTAVDSVDLVIEPGELFFVIGPSGCGKTTLLRMIAGIILPTSGRIFFGEREVTQLPTQKRGTAMVFQGYALWPHMSVAENVVFGLKVRKVGRAERDDRVRRALSLVQMEKFAERKPAELSGGQQQRVALARALVVNPDVLLLDEPLSNLDAALRVEMRSEIRRICKSVGITTVFVTHDQEEALGLADRITIMRDGLVRQIGSPRELYRRPTDAFVAGFIGQTNLIPGRVKSVNGARVHLESALGPMVSSHFPESARVGDRVTCSIRPEAIRLLTGDGGADNVCDVQSGESVFAGPSTRHTLMVGDDMRIFAVELQNERQISGDTRSLRVGIDAADVVVFRQSTEGHF